MKSSYVCALLAAMALAPTVARADRFPHIASDGLYLGVRLEPGASFALAYDLDVYLTGDRLLSAGPAVTFSFLGEEGTDQGRRQDFLFAVDALRFKVGLLSQGEWRPYIFAGGGFHYASLPDQSRALAQVTLPDGSMSPATLHYPRHDAFGGLVSAGVGLDGYFESSWGLSTAIVAHVRLSDDDRVPLFWAEALVGMRFGL